MVDHGQWQWHINVNTQNVNTQNYINQNIQYISQQLPKLCSTVKNNIKNWLTQCQMWWKNIWTAKMILKLAKYEITTAEKGFKMC